jgi:hypothetical protein
LAPGAALRRAVAKFHGLLRVGSNREEPSLNRFFNREDLILDLAGGAALITRRLIVPLAVAVVTIHAGQGFAQGAFPAPLPGQAAPSGASPFPPVNGASPFPPVNGAAPAAVAPRSSFPVNGAAPVGGGGFAPALPTQEAGPSEDCMKVFLPLRAEAEKRGKLIKAASDRHAGPDEACKLFASYSQAEIKMIKYVESNASKCGIPPQIADQLKTSHKNTDTMQQKVCSVAQQQQQRGPVGPSLSEVLGASAALPEAATAKKGGSTFDTLNGNVLAR